MAISYPVNLQLIRGHILSSKPSSTPSTESKKRKKHGSEFVEQSAKSMSVESTAAKAGGAVKRKAGERRNNYQTISTALYYRTERRGGQAQWPAARMEVDIMPGVDESSYDGGN